MDFIGSFKLRRARKAVGKTGSALANFRHTEDDLLSDAGRGELDALIAEARELRKTGTPELCESWTLRSNAAWKKLNPHAAMREWLDIFAVALMVAFGIRGLFFQPFKIPTSSMQPTLFGIHYVDTAKANAVNGLVPGFGKLGGLGNFLAFSTRRAYLDVTPASKMGNDLYPVRDKLIFDSTRLVLANGKSIVMPGTPAKVAEYLDLYPGKPLSGVVSDGFLSSGDHLFVDRLSLLWREPERGDIMVFATEGIEGPRGEKPSDSGDYYIKRLMGLPGDTLRITDGVLYVKPAGAADFKPIYELAPKTEKLYSGQGGYQGHINMIPGETNFLRSGEEEYKVPENRYFMLGDNTRFSADSRVWGTVPRKNLVGRPAIIFWPISRRWGLPDRAKPLETPTGIPGIRTFKSMYLQ